MSEEMTLDEYRAILNDPEPGKKNKFSAIKTIASDGTKCDSKAEARRWENLLLMQRAGEISELQAHPAWNIEINGYHVTRYTADASYIDHGILVVEDVKSKPTRKKVDYIIRKKLMYALFKIEIKEVE